MTAVDRQGEPAVGSPADGLPATRLPTNETLITEVRQALEGVTEGPWAVTEDDFDGYAVVLVDNGPGQAFICSEVQQGDDDGATDARFIAAARQLVPALADALHAADTERNELLEAVRISQASEVKVLERAHALAARLARAEQALTAIRALRRASLVKRVLAATAYSYEAGEYPDGMDADVSAYVTGDGGLMNALTDLLAVLAVLDNEDTTT